MRYLKPLLLGLVFGATLAVAWERRAPVRAPSSAPVAPIDIQGYYYNFLTYANLPCPSAADVARYDADFHVEIDPSLRIGAAFIPPPPPRRRGTLPPIRPTCDTQLVRTRIYQALYMAERLSLAGRPEYPAYLNEALQAPFQFLKKNIRSIRFDGTNTDAGAYNSNHGDIYLTIRAVDARPFVTLEILMHEAKHSLADDPGHTQCRFPSSPIYSRTNRCDESFSMSPRAGAYTISTIFLVEMIRQFRWVTDADRQAFRADALNIIANSFNDSESGFFTPTERIAAVNRSDQLGWVHPYTKQFVLDSMGVDSQGMTLRGTPMENQATLIRNGRAYRYDVGAIPTAIPLNEAPPNIVDLAFVTTKERVPFGSVYQWASMGQGVAEADQPVRRRRGGRLPRRGLMRMSQPADGGWANLMKSGLAPAYLTAANQLSYYDSVDRRLTPLPAPIGALRAKRYLMGPDGLQILMDEQGLVFVSDTPAGNFKLSAFRDPNMRPGGWISLEPSLFRDFVLAVDADGVAYVSQYRRTEHDLAPVRLDTVFPALPEPVLKVTEGYEALLAVGRSGNLHYLPRGARAWKLLPLPGGAVDAAFVYSGKQVMLGTWSLDTMDPYERASFQQRCGADYIAFDIRTQAKLGIRRGKLVFAALGNGPAQCHELSLPSSRRGANVVAVSYIPAGGNGPRQYDQPVVLRVAYSDGTIASVRPYQD